MRINPGLTEAEYESLSYGHIEWMVHIHELVESDRARREQEAMKD